MSYLVMIEFEDPDSAQSFVMNRNLPDQLGYSVFGKWLLPKSMCKCPHPPNLKNWSRANKAGVPVCLKCKKPSKHWLSGLKDRLSMALGNNRLED